MNLQTRDHTEEKTWFTCHGYVERDGRRSEICYGSYGYDGTFWGGATPYPHQSLADAIDTLKGPPAIRNGGVAWEKIKDKFVRRHYQKVVTQTTYGVEIVDVKAERAPALGGTPGVTGYSVKLALWERERCMMPVEEFLSGVRATAYTDDDGYGHPVRGDHWAELTIKPSMCGRDIPADATHIVWYNR